jgi:D-alanyl-D-alanine carboxypeptidase/D-alanyl-D-alanine-endopeptidase (penicillin-binding protein 4)
MKLLFFIFTLWMTSLFSLNANAWTSTNSASLNNAITRALGGVSPYTHIGITIKSMRYGDTLYSHNDKTLFVPASTLKVLTADASSINDGVVMGNIYLVNSGDPTMTYSDLAELIESLKARHITTIHGNVYIDNSAYDEVNTGPGWLWNDKRFCYAAPISASILNHNCLSYRDTPLNGPGRNTKGITDPRVYYAKVENAVVTHARSNTCYLNSNGSMIAIPGCLGKNPAVSSVIHDVVQYNKSLLKSLLARNGIEVEGVIATASAKPLAHELARHDSKPLKDMISDMLKMSDNVIAGSIFKKLGQMYTHRPGTWESGGIAVAQILSQQASLDIWRMSLIDGSGLSRYNQVTPAQMLKVLEFAFHNHATNYDFMSALPVAGVDGTLKRRMHNIAWRVRAKTGTLQGVIALAGYAITADKEPVAFVIMINGRNGTTWKYRGVEDKIMATLTQYSRRT